ncbi:NACHT domain-containing protein [Niastella caeni]|nr:NACHT domain-containing protein [Niastella caeni]
MIQELILKKILEKALQEVSRFFRERKFVFDSGEKDFENAISRHTQEVINWSSEITFKDLSQNKYTSKVFIDLDVYLMPIKTKIEASEKIQKITSKNLFSHTPKHLAILGQPGAGKTTLTKFICQSILIDESYYPEEFRIPLLIRLRDLNNYISEKSGRSPIINFLFDLLGLTIRSKDASVKEEEMLLAKERLLIPILEELKSLIILDGFDEIAEKKNREKVLEDFRKLTLSCNNTRLLITSRSSDFNYSFENVAVMEICPLNDNQVKEFARRWLVEDYKVADFLGELEKSPFVDTAIRPITIGHLCAIYERSGKIPDKPKTVYRKIVSLLLEEWDEQRGVRRVSQYGSFELDRKLEFLCRLSYELSVEYQRTNFSSKNLKTIYNRICIDFDLKKDENVQVISEIEGHTGLILEAGYKKYEFAHKSLQEYMCAEHLVKLPSIPDLKLLTTLPNELAIAVTVSSNPSLYFTELVLNHFIKIKIAELFIINFVNRLLLEKPDFNTSPEVSLAIIVLYSLFRDDEVAQATLFHFDLPKQFGQFVDRIFLRNKKLSINGVYDVFAKDEMDSGEIVLRLRKKGKRGILIGKYESPEIIHVKKSFVADLDDQFVV